MKYLLLLLPLVANAGELELACNLERSKAEVRASTLAAPRIIGQLGQDATSGEKALIAGVSQSFSGRAQAEKLRESAEAKCDALRSTLQLDEHGRWSQLQVQRDGAKAELQIIEQAIVLAKSNISQLDAQLAAQTITINQHTEGRSALVGLEQREADLLRLLSVIVLTPPQTNISSLLESARISEGQAARLTAQASADRGWDIVVAAGARQPQNGSAQPYATIGFSYSFGEKAAQRAARDIGTQTAELLAAQQGGYAQTVLRQRETLIGLIEAETRSSSTTARQETHLRRVRESILGIETALALNTLRSLDLQLKVLEAEKIGAEARLSGYKALLEKL